jgi:hypothetical protein
MSIFFFSFDNNEEKNSSGIQALTGLKSIVIPEKRLPNDLKEFMIDGKEQTEAYLTNSLINLFNHSRKNGLIILVYPDLRSHRIYS